MPAWCANTLSANGKSNKSQLQLKGFVEKSVSENGAFSLSPTYPIPSSELYIQPGSMMNNGLAIIIYRSGNQEMLKQYLNYEWVINAKLKSLSEIEEYLIKSKSADLDLGLKAFNNLNKYGATDCYDWCEKNWGCKYDIDISDVILNEPNKFQVGFFTPWNPPLGWLTKISKNYPSIAFKYEWEIAGVEYGKMSLFNGKIKSQTLKKLAYYKNKNVEKQLQKLIVNMGLNYNQNVVKNEK